MKRGISIALALCVALMSRAAISLEFEPSAPIRMNSGGGVLPNADAPSISVSISYDENAASKLEYEWTKVNGTWVWVPKPYCVEFTVTNQSTCFDATVTLTGPTDITCSNGKTAADFALDGATFGVSASENGALSQSVDTDMLSCENCTQPGYDSGITSENLYYHIVPADGKSLTYQQADQVESAKVTSLLTFTVSASSEHAHGQGEAQ